MPLSRDAYDGMLVLQAGAGYTWTGETERRSIGAPADEHPGLSDLWISEGRPELESVRAIRASNNLSPRSRRNCNASSREAWVLRGAFQ